MDAARKAKLGERWVCFSCSAKFYDLNRPEPICPKCGTDQRESPAFKQKRGRKKSKKAPAKKAPKVDLELVEEPQEPDLVSSFDDGEEPDELDIDELEIGSDDDDLTGVEVNED